MNEGATPAEDHELRADSLDDAVPSAAFQKLPVVGLGGSAGAIPALIRFFENVPDGGGVAYVVVLHLSPSHDSVLAEVLQRATRMRVVQVLESQPLEPDTVFVIPPGKALQSLDGSLRVVPLRRDASRHVTVDLFFRTLADTHGPHGAAVVLSGMDGDGSIGIRRVKERGGLTVAQDPDEAENSGMPRSAIATGMVDWVLPVVEIASRVADYFHREQRLRLPPEHAPKPPDATNTPTAADEAAFRDVLTFLRTRTGRDFSSYKRATILRRIARRMQVNGVDDVAAYLGCLRTRPGEAGALLQDLLISVTNFFRDPECFAALKERLPRLFHGKGTSDSIRVWVSACASGEEAYSVAIMLAEYARELDAPPQVQIFASDLDDDALRIGREGIYTSTIEADVSEDRLRRFFVREHAGYRVRRELREMVLFAAHDLLKDSPFSRVDLVTCRNLMIYLTREAQQRVLDIFHFALQPGGLLFLGASESVEDGTSKFSVLDKKLRLYERRSVPRTPLPMPGGPSTLALAMQAQQHSRNGPFVPGPAFAQTSLLQRPAVTHDGRPGSWGELHYRALEQMAPPSLIVDREHEVLHMSPSAGRFMQLAGGEPSNNLLRLIHPALRIELRAALYEAARNEAPARTPALDVELSSGRERVSIEVRPIADLDSELALILLHDEPGSAAAPDAEAHAAARTDPVAKRLDGELERLKVHLRDTVEQYEVSTEELKASNEELQAMNEELRSATEELETSREELQSINEELTTVNQELKGKVDELGHSNSDMQNLMDATAIATVFLDRELRVTRYTPSAVELFSLIPGDVGRPLSDLASQLHYAELHADARRVLERLAPVEREIRDKSDNWYLVRALPYRTLDDRIAGVVFTFVDITERKHGQEALRLSDQRFAAVFNQASVGVVQATLDGSILYTNRFHADLLGYAVDDLVGKQLLELVHPDDKAAARQSIDALTAQPDSFQLTQRVLRKDGATLWLHRSVTALTDPAGHTSSILIVSVDLTERRMAEIALRRSEERLRLIVDNVLDFAILSIDLDRRVTHWNPGAERLFGYSEAELMGLRFDRLFTPEDRAAHVPEAEVEHALRHGKSADNRQHLRKDGTRLWVSGALMAMQDLGGSGATVGFVKIMHDESDERESRQALEQGGRNLMLAIREKEEAMAALEVANAAKDRFLAVLAHELRNPLASVGAAADVMLTETADASDRTLAATVVRHQVDAMRVLLSDLLDVSLLRLNKLVLQLRRTELVAVVRAAVETSRHGIEAAGHQLTIALPDHPVMLHADPVRLSQVLSNLLQNATKYTPPGGQIRLEADVEGREAVFVVWDNGIGMRPESVESMFDMFTREHAQANPMGGPTGLGIGLALARNIVALHGGTISGESEGPGTGSCFVVRLPLAEEPAAPAAAPAAEPAERETARRRVLVVDDNLDALWGMATLLRAAGHEVVSASSGEQALALATERPPEVVMLDIGMAGLNGHEVARRLRAQPWGAELLLIAATGWGGRQDVADSKAAGFDAHLVKPIDLAELRALIASHQRPQ